MDARGENNMNFALDIPQLNDDAWQNVSYFETLEEAIKYAQEHFGADDAGRITLVSEMPSDELDDPAGLL